MGMRSAGAFVSRAWRERAHRPSWELAEPGMHTGTLNGEVVGHVIVAGGGFIAFDATSATVGRFDTLSEAQQAAAAPPA